VSGHLPSDRTIGDIDAVIANSEDDLRSLSRSRIYLTGGTGFIGKWILRAFARANDRLRTHIRLDVLTRDPQGFRQINPDLVAAEGIRLLGGNVAAPAYDGTYDAVIHGAASSGKAVKPSETIETIVDGTRAVLRNVAVPSGAIPFLFLSSGAVYGPQPSNVERLAEDYFGSLDHLDTRLAYSESKRLAELSLVAASLESAVMPKVARLFAFLGPGVPLDAHFAAGNFIGDAVFGRPIIIKSHGSAMRSYLYPTDLVSWCFAVLCRGKANRPYNIGSDEPVAIKELARRVAELSKPQVRVEVRGSDDASAERWYVPDVRRAIAELGVRRTVGLDDAIARTIRFYRSGTAAW
jgi:dTDP-glucose 4,6-dehydratase